MISTSPPCLRCGLMELLAALLYVFDDFRAISNLAPFSAISTGTEHKGPVHLDTDLFSETQISRSIAQSS